MARNIFFEELKRRKVFKVASIYVVTAWLIIQVVATTFPMFELPNWSQRLIVIMIIIGFPIVLILAWVQERVAPKRAETDDSKTKWVTPVLISILGLVGLVIWWTRFFNGEKKILLPMEIRSEKVAVSIFDNQTGDENLRMLGFLGSEWISAGLREIGIKTVSSDMVRQYQESIGIIPGDPDGRPAFSEITGASYIIRGSYYLHGQHQDSIRLLTRLSSAETGEDIQDFPVIFGQRGQMEKLVDEARERFLGYWAIRKDFKLPSTEPPRNEAYQAFIKCTPPYLPCYLDVVAKDSSFMLARVFLLQAAAVYDQDSIYKVNEAFIQQNWDACTQYEKNYFRYITAEQERDFETAFKAIEANYQLDTNNIFMINEYAIKAWWLINRPDICQERFEQLFNRTSTYGDKFWYNNFLHYVDVLNHFGRYQDAVDFANRFERDYWFENAGVQPTMSVCKSFIALKKIKEAIELEEELNNFHDYNSGKPDIGFYSFAASTYATLFPDETHNPFLLHLDSLTNKLASAEAYNSSWFWATGMRTGHPAKVHYLLKNWDEAEAVIQQMKGYDWEERLQSKDYPFPISNKIINQSKMQVEGFLGCIYARKGDNQAALEQVQILEKLISETPPTRNIFLFGMGHYLQARILAILGEKEAAVQYLQKAIKKGLLFGEVTVHDITSDFDLATLQGYEPYEELIRMELLPLKQ